MKAGASPMPSLFSHNRKDGTFIKPGSAERAMFPYVMTRRCDSMVYFDIDVPVDNLLLFLRKKKPQLPTLSMFEFILVCLAKTFAERPELNRFLVGRRFYQRNRINFSFIVRKEMNDASDDVNVQYVVDPSSTPEQMLEELDAAIARAKANGAEDVIIPLVMRLPRLVLLGLFKLLKLLDFYGLFPNFLATEDPMRCSLFVSNLGSIGLDSAFHHLYEWGTCSVFLTIGRIRRRPVCMPDGSMVTKAMCSFKFTVDERIAAGYYIARSLDVFRRLMQNPETLFPD